MPRKDVTVFGVIFAVARHTVSAKSIAHKEKLAQPCLIYRWLWNSTAWCGNIYVVDIAEAVAHNDFYILGKGISQRSAHGKLLFQSVVLAFLGKHRQHLVCVVISAALHHVAIAHQIFNHRHLLQVQVGQHVMICRHSLSGDAALSLSSFRHVAMRLTHHHFHCIRIVEDAFVARHTASVFHSRACRLTLRSQFSLIELCCHHVGRLMKQSDVAVFCRQITVGLCKSHNNLYCSVRRTHKA